MTFSTLVMLTQWAGGSEKVQNYADIIYEWSLREQVAKLRTELRIVKKENEDLKQTTKLNTPQKSIKNHNNQEEWIDSSLGLLLIT